MPRIRRPSPALVVATVALVVAGTGTTYAVGIAPNSVGTPQLKANAVTAVKVKDGMLRISDFRAADRKSLRGVRGAAGPAGAASAVGAQGARARPARATRTSASTRRPCPSPSRRRSRSSCPRPGATS